MKRKVLTVYWDNQYGEATVKFEDYYKQLTGIAKLDFVQDLLFELDLVSKEGFNWLNKLPPHPSISNANSQREEKTNGKRGKRKGSQD